MRKHFDSSSEIANYLSTETIWKKNNFFLLQIFFFSFEVFDRGIFEVSGIILFCQFCQNCIQRIQRNDLMKILPFKNLEFYTSSGLWLKSLLTSCWKTSARLSKLYFGVQSTFKRTDFLRIVQIFLFFLYFHWLSFIFVLNFSAAFPKLQSTCHTINSRKNIWFEIFIFDFFKFFRIWGKNFRTFGDNCSTALSKLHYLCQRNKVREYCFEKLYTALTTFGLQGRSLRTLDGIFSQFRPFCNLCVQRNILD